MHHCLLKSIRIAGLSECLIRYLPLDEEFRIIAQLFEKQVAIDINLGLNPFLVIASAGTTNTGAIDPLKEIGNIAQKYNIWFHVDGAYGAFFMLVEKLKNKFTGIEMADSVVMDPHKGLFLPYGCGVILVKNRKFLIEAHKYSADYMQDTLNADEEYSPADMSPELTKHFRGLRIWLPLQLTGVAPFRAALEEKILLTRYFYNEIQKLGFEVGPFPELSVMSYRFVPKNGDANEFNKKLLELLHQDGRVFISSTSLNGKFVLRLAVLSFRTHLTTINLALEMIEENLEKLIKEW